MPTLGIINLKEVDGYKIRILSRDDLINNLGWKSGMRTKATTSGNDVPLWVYNCSNYWTMQSYNGLSVYFIQGNYINSSGISYYTGFNVRPVINLYKSAID